MFNDWTNRLGSALQNSVVGSAAQAPLPSTPFDLVARTFPKEALQNANQGNFFTNFFTKEIPGMFGRVKNVITGPSGVGVDEWQRSKQTWENLFGGANEIMPGLTEEDVRRQERIQALMGLTKELTGYNSIPSVITGITSQDQGRSYVQAPRRSSIRYQRRR